MIDDELPTNDDSGSGALPAAPPPPPPSTEPSSLFSLLAWTRIASQLEAFGPAMYLKSGHTLTFRTLAHYLNDTHLPLGAMDRNTLRDLAPSLLVRVEAGATLVMQNVTLLLSCADLATLLRGLCSSTAGWPESPGVALRGGDMLISSLDTVAPGPDGRRGGGGAVQWRDVNMTCARTPTQGAGPPYCTAGTVRDAAELHSLLGQPTAGGPTIASLAADTTLPRDGSWAPPNASTPDAQLLLLGRPGLTSVLDLAERQWVWVSSAPGLEAAAPVVNLYDVTLVNLPYATSPSSAGGLLALELPSFVVERRLPSSPSPSGTALLSLVNCTLVLPDPEFAFLAGAVQRNASDLVQYTYGVPAEGGGVAATGALRIRLEASQAPPPVAESAPYAVLSPLKLDLLEMWPRLSCRSCTLLAASSYGAALPGAAGLQARPWPPLALLRGDQEQAAKWPLQGPIAVRVAPGFEEALAVQSVGCGDPPLRARVTAIPPAAAAASRTECAFRGISSSLFLVLCSGSPSGLIINAAAAAAPEPIVVAAAGDGDDGCSCTVAGFPAELSPEGARTFIDLRAASSRAYLGRSLVLRDLVLYNLAPGGWGWSWGPADGPVNPTASTGASTASPPGALAPLPDGPLQGADAAWANSSLPLWYFGVPSRAPAASTPASTAPPSPLLRLDNVTLVVPEAEWRALAAAVLTQHAAAAASQPARSDGAARLLLQGPAAVAADDATARGALMRFAAASVSNMKAVSQMMLRLAPPSAMGTDPVSCQTDEHTPDETSPPSTVTTSTPTATATVTASAVQHLAVRAGASLGSLVAGGSSPYGDEDGTTAAQSRGEDVFLQDVGCYFSRRRDQQASSEHSEAWTESIGAGPPLPGRQRGQGVGGLSRVIQTLQAELLDSQLQVYGLLGSGSYGAVYRGSWRGLPVAVKTLVVSDAAGAAGNGSCGSAARHRAVLETAISMSMNHPNVVATYTYHLKPLVADPSSAYGGNDSGGDSSGGGGDGDADVYKLLIVQELGNGGSLKQALRAGVAGSVLSGGRPRALALRLAADAAAGMAHVHACRIVHGDLKPGNVLLTYKGSSDDTTTNHSGEGGRGVGSALERLKQAVAGMPTAAPSPLPLRAKVADFGLSLPLAEGATHASRCFQGTPEYQAPEVADFGLSLPLAEGATHASRCFQGTPEYQAPEVLSAGRQSPQSDVWSFGLVLLELFYGCSLPDMWPLAEASGLAAPALHTALLQGALQCPDSLCRSFAHLAGSCLATDPRDRPDFEELAAQLAGMLAEAVAGESATSHDAGTAPKIQ
ncbi:hypothetical protein GPECTOR_269g694 [Gonium pectorale]|uniref:Protein kinase domain-containing protein n=1 Tax=Gonium pectorale TaxID=33097 RepID=A0A150FW50_GONPE|nr:hypothetical protein GPECTOR_269g694 [Gonium pectorale]|eukprot:KXZ41829.1 hypothetical protein GPECTOR_269g694 [Gonium pectorale]